MEKYNINQFRKDYAKELDKNGFQKRETKGSPREDEQNTYSQYNEIPSEQVKNPNKMKKFLDYTKKYIGSGIRRSKKVANGSQKLLTKDAMGRWGRNLVELVKSDNKERIKNTLSLTTKVAVPLIGVCILEDIVGGDVSWYSLGKASALGASLGFFKPVRNFISNYMEGRINDLKSIGESIVKSDKSKVIRGLGSFTLKGVLPAYLISKSSSNENVSLGDVLTTSAVALSTYGLVAYGDSRKFINDYFTKCEYNLKNIIFGEQKKEDRNNSQSKISKATI